jgi:hypothetical protein
MVRRKLLSPNKERIALLLTDQNDRDFSGRFIHVDQDSIDASQS